MRTLSPSAEKICVIAVEHFANSGYDACSLNDIAVAAGMRKPSLYAHFSSKDDLFQAVFERAVEAERLYVEDCFAHPHGDVPGGLYCQRLGERYLGSAHLRYLLRTAFFPPTELRAWISAGFEGYLARLAALFVARMKAYRPTFEDEQAVLYRDAYMGIVDSLAVELIYAGPEAYARRLAALWKVFEDSLARSGAEK